MVQVSFGAQPQPQTQERKSYALPAGIVGAAAGAGVAKFTSLGKTDQYKDADEFVRTASEDDLKEIKDKADDVETLKKAIANRKTQAESNDKAVTDLYGDKADLPHGDVLPKAPKIDNEEVTFDSLKATLQDNADEAIKKEEEELKKIEEAAGKLEKGKSEALKDGDKELGISVAKDADGKVTFTKGSEAVVFEDHSKAVKAKRATFTKKKELAEALGIKADTNAEGFKISKDNAKKLFEKAVDDAPEDAKNAYKNIQDLLPKKIHWGKFAAITGGAAVLAGLLGYAAGGSSKN